MTEYMADAPITREWLEWYGDAWRAYEEYIKQKETLEKRINGLSAIRYDTLKVSKGNGATYSEEEHYVLRLEKIDRAIRDCEEVLLPAKARLKQQISRIHKSEYRKVLILRYVERWKWIDIINECFWYEDDLNYNFEKYKTKVMYWNRAALERLEELSSIAYIPAERQITIGLEQ